MKRRRFSLIILLLIGAAALAGALLCESMIYERLTRKTLDYTDEEILKLPYFELIAFSDENHGLSCDVVSYSLGDGIIHFVLPEGTGSDNFVVYVRDAGKNLLARRVYDLSGNAYLGSWEIVADTHVLPVLYFETNDPDVFSKMTGSETKDIICGGKLHICVDKKTSAKNGWFEESATASLQGRGSTSWEYADRKKSYTLRFGRSLNILGMGSSKSFNLLGDPFDPSLLKDITFNEISERAGILYQPQMRKVNLYVDGVYQGVYTLTSKVKAGKERIPLRHGDFLFRMDPPEPGQPIPYSSVTWFADGAEYPVADLVYPENASEVEMNRAKAVIQDFIDAVESADPEELSRVCDVDLLARYYWVEEASMNFDAWQRSTYLYYRKDDKKIHMGPVWDMDLALGSPYTKETVPVTFDTPEGWKIRYGGWYTALFENEAFVKAVRDTYHKGGVSEELKKGVALFEDNRKDMGTDACLNYAIFGHANRGTALEHGNSYDEYCDNMIEFYRTRLSWIDDAMKEEK